MGLFRESIIILLVIPLSSYGKDSLNDLISLKCPIADYRKYIECVEGMISAELHGAHNTSTGLTESSSLCTPCDCKKCKKDNFGGFSGNNCCSKCCPFKPCENRHCCFKTCHSICKTTDCRYSCRQSCFKFIENISRKRIISKQTVSNRLNNDDALNITTKIDLYNLINNMNNLDIPVRMNSTNENEIIVEHDNRQENIVNARQSSCCDGPGILKCKSTAKFPFITCLNLTSCACSNITESVFGEVLCGNSKNCGSFMNPFMSRYVDDILGNRNLLILNVNDTTSSVPSSFLPVRWVQPFSSSYSVSLNPNIHTPYQFHSQNFLPSNFPVLPMYNSPSPVIFPSYYNSYFRTPYPPFMPLGYQSPSPYISYPTYFQPFNTSPYTSSYRNFHNLLNKPF